MNLQSLFDRLVFSQIHEYTKHIYMLFNLRLWQYHFRYSWLRIILADLVLFVNLELEEKKNIMV